MIKKTIISFLVAIVVVFGLTEVTYGNSKKLYEKTQSISTTETTVASNSYAEVNEEQLNDIEITNTTQIYAELNELEEVAEETTIETTKDVFETEEVTEETEEEIEPEEEYVYTLQDRFADELAMSAQYDYLLEQGWDFILTSEDFGSDYGYTQSICGLTVYGERTVYIRESEWSIRRSTLHEIGHAVDYECGWASETPEFRDIFDREKYNFTDCVSIGDGHEISNVNEYFASVYQNMILDYWGTVDEVPDTVDYIERQLGTL
jgi:hypothetical protein